MALLTTPAGDLGFKAPDFTLPDPDGRTWRLTDLLGESGLVVAFICNHCPYVKAVIDRFVTDAGTLQAAGYGVVAIMSNDWTTHPADAPDRMRAFARDHAFPFPYLIDETQDVARAYGAVCTPDLYGFDGDLTLMYRGRIDSAANRPAGPDTRRELRDAMLQVAETGIAPSDQVPSVGCSIKWHG